MVFRRIGWKREDYQAWSDRLLAEEFAFVVPTTHEGETVTRFAIVNPTTTEDDILAILDTMSTEHGVILTRERSEERMTWLSFRPYECGHPMDAQRHRGEEHATRAGRRMSLEA